MLNNRCLDTTFSEKKLLLFGASDCADRSSCDHVENFRVRIPTFQAKKFTLLNMEALKDVSTMYVLTPELTFSPSLARTWLV